VCGIAGIVWADPLRAEGPEPVRRALRAIAHRGPDGEGVLAQPGISAGMRRLSIIDIEGGQQPIFNETGGVAVLYNGEIYNFIELRRDLEARGHRFKTRSDTEVIVHSYEEYGPSFVERLDGMFAFVVWDATHKRALFGRDRFGIKPLHLASTRHGLAFASEIKAMVAAGWIEPQLNRAAVPSYVRLGWVPDQLSLWQGVRRLPPGHFLEVVGGVEKEPECYHRHRIGGSPRKSTPEVDEELDSLLRAAVARQLVADVPVGVFLSGGIDSSLLVAMAAGRTDLPCHTIDFPNDATGDLGESDAGYARLVADTFGLDLTIHSLEPNTAELLPQMMRALDEPSGDPAVLNAYLLAKAARPHTKVLLSGMGADEVAGGYRRHSAARWSSPLYRLPLPLRSSIASAARFASSKLAIPLLSEMPLVRRIRKGLGRLPADVEQVPESFAVWLDSERTRSLGLSDRSDAWAQVTRGLEPPYPTNPLEACLGFDVTTYLPSHNLFYTDKTTMAASVEVRVPYLDNALSEFLMGLPIDQKVSLNSTKLALRRAARKRLPEAVWKRKKTGFGLPIRAWLRGDLKSMRNDLLSAEAVRRRGLFAPEGVRHLIDSFDRRLADVAYPIWHLLALEIWCREVLENRTEEDHPSNGHAERMRPL
jgi:asparagine synthase (glutamine-hydrolysing)